MLEKIKKWTGLEKRNPYINEYFERSNLRSSIYMAIIVVVLEGWMLKELTDIVLKYRSTVEKMRNPYWLFTHYGRYGWLFLMGIIILIYAGLYFSGKKVNMLVGHILIWIFALSCILFGIYVGYHDYEEGEQILTFLTMTTFTLCLLVWRPVISFAISSLSFGGFYYLINSHLEVSRATRFNLLTMWICTLTVAVSIYFQRYIEAKKDENLEIVNKHLRYISDYDELTGLHNLRYFTLHIHKQIEEISSKGKKAAVLYLDIENFKSYNDRYGFEAGDALLAEFSSIINEKMDEESVARFSDDHFLIMAEFDEGKKIVDELAKNLKELSPNVRLELKAGAYVIDNSEEDIPRACDYARVACNETKRKFDVSFFVFDEKLGNDLKRKQYIINNIDKAIENEHIKVYYQPIMDSRLGTMCGMEALARWDDPELGLLPPYQFIPVLEEYHEIGKLDKEIMRQVCRDIDKSKGTPLEKVPVSINFSRIDFDLYDVPAVLLETANRYNVNCDMLHVEITESALNGDMEGLKATMDVIRREGYTQWLDDFGSGYSSLNVLKDYKFDVLKIDMVFLKGFDTNPDTKTVIESIVNLAKTLNMKTLTEGVETKEMYEFLKSIGCDMCQGYYFGKPEPLQRIFERIQMKEIGV